MPFNLVWLYDAQYGRYIVAGERNDGMLCHDDQSNKMQPHAVWADVYAVGLLYPHRFINLRHGTMLEPGASTHELVQISKQYFCRSYEETPPNYLHRSRSSLPDRRIRR
jgi:hypothetical protein